MAVFQLTMSGEDDGGIKIAKEFCLQNKLDQSLMKPLANLFDQVHRDGFACGLQAFRRRQQSAAGKKSAAKRNNKKDSDSWISELSEA